MKHFWLVALCLAGCTKKNENPTPSGANILAWDLSQAERESVRAAKTSDVNVQDIDYTAHPTEDTSVKVKIHLETATIVFNEGGGERTHSSPIKIGMTLVDGADYTLDRGKCMGPHYKLAAPGEAPRDMILHCIVKATKPNAQVSFTIYAYGDGKIDDGVAK
jgi:hypothetical protein